MNSKFKNNQSFLSVDLEQDFQLVQEDHSVLHTVASPVSNFDSNLYNYCQRFKQAMIDFGGIGLAAPQIGWSQRVICLLNLSTREPEIWINPAIDKSFGWQISKEGCLSLPNKSIKKLRNKTVTIKGYDESGQYKEQIKHALSAACVQHEIDHLNGILMSDNWL